MARDSGVGVSLPPRQWKMVDAVRLARDKEPDLQTIVVDTTPRALRLFKTYLELHQGTAVVVPLIYPLRSNSLKEHVPDEGDWKYIEYVAGSKHDLYELTRLAHDMGLEPLLDLCCAKIASLIIHQPLGLCASLLDPGEQLSKSL